MFLFGKKKKEKEIIEKETIVNPSDIYIKNVNEYVSYYGKLLNVDKPLDDFEFYKKYAVPYYNSAMNIVNFVGDKYPDDVLASDDVIEFDYDGLVSQMNDETKSLFFKPNFPNLIYINESKYFTHFHVQDNVVTDSEGVEFLPGLSYSLANQKINRLFEGLSVYELRDLLFQMGILPKDSELQRVIDINNELSYFNKKFLESVVALFLVVHRTQYALKRARLFADSLGIDFDFTPFEKKEDNHKKLVI